MATAAGHCTKGLFAPKVYSIDKENISPEPVKPQQKPRKTRNVNGIFDRALHDRRQKHAVQDVLSPQFTGISKASAVKPGYFTSLQFGRFQAGPKKSAASPLNVEALLHAAQGQKAHTLGLGGTEIMERYVESTTDNFASKIEDYGKQLEAARKGVDHITGQPSQKPGVPSKAEFDELTEKLEQLKRPFEDDTVTLLFENPNDPANPIAQETRVGDIKDNCLKRYAKQMAKHKKLEQQHATIDEEMEVLKQEIIEDASNNNRAAKEFEKQMKAFEKERAQIEAQAKAERAELKQEQDNATDALNRKIKQLFELL
ncbi:hypothetical protein Slin14017_G095410 [Septoria linicola]|nr:hypothetical protein Slin14017_G095410 [Septoria linicola]